MITAITHNNDLANCQPRRWDDIVGNEKLKEHFKDMIHCVRKEGHLSGFNLLLTGSSRTGKSSTIAFAVKCIGCYDLDFNTLDPCGKCDNCKAKHSLLGNDGWENWADFLSPDEAPTPIRYLYMPLDCTRLTETDLEDCLAKVRVDDGNLKVIYFDEVHRLNRRFMTERLLKPLEDVAAIWIASSANLRKGESATSVQLDTAFCNRFPFKITTQIPTKNELANWLLERCQQWGLTCDEPKELLMRLAERSNCIPGLALQVLNRIYKSRAKQITRAMVESHQFEFDE